MKLYAWIGMEENPTAPQRVGLKQGMCAAGMVPLVAMDFDQTKILNAELVRQLQAQADTYGVEIRLAEFHHMRDVVTLTPRGDATRRAMTNEKT